MYQSHSVGTADGTAVRTPSLVVACRDVMGYEHPQLIERLKQKEGLTHEEAEIVYQDMLRFLSLCGRRNSATKNMKLAPPESIDIAWHHFILFTEDYAKFCDKFFGRFIHHYPSPARERPTENLLEKTIALAEATFGSLSSNWLCPAGPCSGSTNCQSSTSDCSN